VKTIEEERDMLVLNSALNAALFAAPLMTMIVVVTWW